jgi:hypothetical protein
MGGVLMVHHVVRLRAHGLRLQVEGGQLRVSPASRLESLTADEASYYDPKAVEAIRQERADLVVYIRQHRDEIIAVLSSGDIWKERREEYGRLYQQGQATEKTEAA